MIRRRLPALLGAAATAALVAWIASQTYWDDVDVPTPLGGEARTNPFYAAQRLAEALGARTQWDRVFTPPPADAIVVLSGWHWNLSAGRRERLEQWVESGGRLVTDRSLVGRETTFTEWSGVSWRSPEADEIRAFLERREPEVSCRVLRLAGEPARPQRRSFQVCGMLPLTSLTSEKPTAWRLEDDRGVQALRVALGRGSLTVLNSELFTFRTLLDADHAHLFVAAAQLRRGDAVHFLNEADHPSLLGLLWMYGWPSVALGLLVTALGLWRGAVRTGPLHAPPDGARRSLAEQVQGIGRFALHFGGGAALHAAAVRALHETAARTIRGYARLSTDEQAAAIARLTGGPGQAIREALVTGAPRRPPELRAALALLEEARRALHHHPRDRRTQAPAAAHDTAEQTDGTH